MASFETEKREFIRVGVAVAVRYKFLSHEIKGPDMEKVWEGTTSNLSGGGILLRGKVPQLEWLPPLLTGKMKVGVNLLLPNYEVPVKALTWVAWIEGLEEETMKAALGLRFKEITKESQDAILRYVIKTQMG